MPKQVWKIEQFHGGINDDSSARDIADHQCTDIDDLAVDRLGKIIVLGDIKTAAKAITASITIPSTVTDDTDTATGGRGLMAIQTDYPKFATNSVGGVATVDTVSTNSSGTAWTNAFYHDVTNSSQHSGDGAKFSVYVFGGAAFITVIAAGSGYVVDEEITVNDDQLGANGGDNLTFNVATITAAGSSGDVGYANKQIYYLAEKDAAIRVAHGAGLEAETDIAVANLAEASMYWVDGGLRIYDADHTTTVTPQWRGYIPGKLYGNISDVEEAKGYIYNSGGTSINQWYSTDAQIKGAFPTTEIDIDSEGKFTVGTNLIAGNWRDCEKGSSTTAQNGPTRLYAFADEQCGTGTGPTAPGDMITSSTMYWGFALGFQETADADGLWAPDGNESYKFYCTTIYDGKQESLPQLFTMYPSGPQAADQGGDASSSNYGPCATDDANSQYSHAKPVSSVQFRNPSNDAGQHLLQGQNIAIRFDPWIKWNGARYDSEAAVSTLAYNFGASAITATSGGNPRITGIKVYWSSSDDGFTDLWELMEWNFEKGVRTAHSTGGGTEGSYNLADWSGNMGTYDAGTGHHNYHHVHAGPDLSIGFMSVEPPKIRRYDQETGHTTDETITVDSFRTSVIAGGRAYIGHVEIDGVIYGDKMMRSGFGEYDKFPSESGDMTLVSNDGDHIVALVEYADRILQFKENSLFIINVSGEYEYLESKHKYKGISNPGAVCSTDYGCAWANQFGCYLYDGNEVTDLLEEGPIRKIKRSTWSTHIHTSNYHRVGYNPIDRQIVVKGGSVSASDAYIFDLVTKSWVFSSSLVEDPNTGSNFINDPGDGSLLIYDDDNNTIDKWAAASGTRNVDYLTKDITFGEASRRKKVYKVYVTYNGGSSTDTACNFRYRLDGAGSWLEFDADFTNTSGAQVTTAFTPSASVNNIKSMQLRIGGAPTYAVNENFEINDISIIYRLKPAK